MSIDINSLITLNWVTMKVLALSDRPIKDGLIQRVLNNQIELIITAGDFSIRGLEQLRSITHIPKIGVYGNHCTRGYMEELGITNIHLNIFEFQGVTFTGFEGCVRYKDSQQSPMWTQEEAYKLVASMPPANVVVSHCPPFGINDNQDLAHQGFHALRDYLIKNQPKYWFHGHTYPDSNEMINNFNDTRIFYTDPEIIVEI